jgi:thioredoxin-like negative regulator of GroEL
VHGLEAEYGHQINFVYLDAALPENVQVQQAYGLRGHPTVAVLDKDGRLVQTFFGPQTADQLRPILQAIISDP